MKILSIGNSFSVDATRYLSRAAKRCGKDITTVNLYIGGCSLYTHYINALEDLPKYALHFNGDDTGFLVSIKQALISREFDIVTLQQASHFSFKPESYEPYTAFLCEYIKRYCPKAKIFVHQTWGYRNGSGRLFHFGFENHAKMYDLVEPAYDIMYQNCNAAGLIPSGKAMSLLDSYGFSGDQTHRDDIHVSLGLGRYTLALTWLEYLTGANIAECDFSDFDVDMSDVEVMTAKKAAHEACLWAQKYKK